MSILHGSFRVSLSKTDGIQALSKLLSAAKFIRIMAATTIEKE
jgi:hypothetical protein